MKKVEFTTATASPAKELVPLPTSDLEALGDTFDRIDGAAARKPWTWSGPVATDFDLLRSLVEPQKTINDVPEPRVPAFDKELLPLIPELTKDAKQWQSTLNEIEDHYETRRKELQSARLQALQVVETAQDVTAVRLQQTIVQRLERALRQIDAEVQKLRVYRNQKLAEL